MVVKVNAVQPMAANATALTERAFFLACQFPCISASWTLAQTSRKQG